MFAGNGDHQNIVGESGTGDDILEVHKDASLGVKNRLSPFLPERYFTDGEILGLTAKETEKQLKDLPKPTDKSVQDPKEDLQNQNEGPASIENSRVCGPMQQNDRLHIIMLGCSALILGLSAVAMFYPAKRHTMSRGMWVLSEQVLSLMGISMTVINILLQILNMVSPIRQMILKNSCIILFILTALVFFVAGLLTLSWLGRLLWKNGSSLHVEPLGCGILLLNSLLCGVCGVIVHVHCSSGPGLLSFNKNFIYHLAAGKADHPVFGSEHNEIDKTSWSFYQKLNRSQNNETDNPEPNKLDVFARLIPDFSEMEELLVVLGEGMTLSKIKSWKVLDRRYFVDPVDLSLYYTGSRIKNKNTRFPITTVMEVREGEKDFSSMLAKYDKSLCFGVVFMGNPDVVYLKAKTKEDRDKWVQGLRYAMKKDQLLKDILASTDRRIEEVFAIADANGDGLVDVDEVYKLLPVLNTKLSEEAAMNVFKAGHKSKTVAQNNKPALTKEDFVRFYHILTRRTDLDEVFLEYSENKNYMSMSDILNFLQNCQKEKNVNEETCAKLVTLYERVGGYKSNQQFSFLGFEKYLLDESQELFNPLHRTVYQDMSKPMTHYFIASSYKTYLAEDQLAGSSKVEMYIMVLCKGCRYIELDVYDGPDEEPIVYNGHILNSKIGFKNVIQAINEYAFKTSPYPVILSIKNHCSIEQQLTMSAYMEAIFCEKLWTEREISATPSPMDLMNKIIVRGNKLSPEDEDALREGDISDEDEENVEEEEEKEVGDEDEENEEEENKEGDDGEKKVKQEEIAVGHESSVDFIEIKDKKKKKVKKIPLHPNLSLITTMKNEIFEDVETAASMPGKFNIFSISEGHARKLCSNEGSEFNVLTHSHFVQIHPAGYRKDSSNYLPTPMWSVGCHMVALNYQTPGEQMQLNDGLFRNNGGCGYVLKPDFLQDVNQRVTGKPLLTFWINVISGMCLPKPKSAGTSSIISPFVKVKVNWGKKQSCSFRTTAVKDNGLNPRWNEDHELKVYRPELAIVNFMVYDENVGKNEILAYYSLPFMSMQQGYRHISLLDNKGVPIPYSRLFVEVSIS